MRYFWPLSLVPLLGCSQGQEPKALNEFNKSELFAAGFKEVLKQKGFSMNLDSVNPLETLQPGNSYSNHFLNLTVNFPDGWQHDRGLGEYSVFRAFEPDSGLMLNLMVIPIKAGLRPSRVSLPSFDDSPLACVNQQFDGDYQTYIQGELTKQLGQEPKDLTLSEVRAGSMHFLLMEYKFKQWVDDMEYFMVTENWMTQRWGTTYQITYTAPELFFDPMVSRIAVNNAKFLDPGFFNNGAVLASSDLGADPPQATTAESSEVKVFVPDSILLCEGSHCKHLSTHKDFTFRYRSGQDLIWLWPKGEFLKFKVLSFDRQDHGRVEKLVVRLVEHNSPKINQDSPSTVTVSFDEQGEIRLLEMTSTKGRTSDLVQVSTFH